MEEQGESSLDVKRKRKRKHVASNNDRMHERNVYKNGYRLETFSATDAIGPFLVRKGAYIDIDWKRADVVHALNASLLKRDFNLSLRYPKERLCPALPLRLNYLLWIEDLLSEIVGSHTGVINGIDIGTGSTCIFPLLGTTMAGHKAYKFYGTDIDPDSLVWAKRNVELNGLGGRIQLFPGSDCAHFAPIFATVSMDVQFHFSVCNPPFFSSNRQWDSNKKCSFVGVTTEMITTGGEVEFLKLMIRESGLDNVRTRCKWFTSMVGIKSSIKALKQFLTSEMRAVRVETCTFFQGRTCRWGIAWTFVVPPSVGLKRAKVDRSVRSLIELPNVTMSVARERLLYFATFHKGTTPSEYNIDVEQSDVEFVVRDSTHSAFALVTLAKSGELGATATVELGASNTAHITGHKAFNVFTDKLRGCLQLTRRWKRRMTSAVKN